MSKTDSNRTTNPIQHLLDDSDIAEILIDGHDNIYVERKGQFEDVPSPFKDNGHLMQMIQTILAPTGRLVNEHSPMVDARLEDGSRVNVVLPPISLIGPVVTIRKFAKVPLTMDHLLRFGSINKPIAEFLQACIIGRRNMIIAGSTGSGKTTVLNILSDYIPKGERIITVENAAEIHLRQPRVISLESRPANIEGKGEVSMKELVVNALRMRPDRIIVGEVRGPEVLDVFQAMNTGHDGTMMTLHANSPRDVLARLEAMATMSTISIPLLTIRQQMATAVHVITQQDRLSDGSRKLTKISEVVGMRGDVIELQDIFEFRRTGLENGRITGNFIATGYIPSFLREFHEIGINLPMSMFTPS